MMALTTKTSTLGNYTVEISYGSEQEIVDRIAALLPNRLWNINFFVRGFTIDGRGNIEVMLRYITAPS